MWLMHIQQKPLFLGLQACLVAIFEVKSSSPDFFRLPDLSQPSVHHDPVPFHTGKVWHITERGNVWQPKILNMLTMALSIRQCTYAAQHPTARHTASFAVVCLSWLW